MPDPLRGRCYCGSQRIAAQVAPLTVAACHCADCRRLSGAPFSAFAAFARDAVQFDPALGPGRSHSAGVHRWFCTDCGTPLAATYDYLPGQIYVPVGVFDAVDTLVPESQSHTGGRVTWLPELTNCPQSTGSGRERLNSAYDGGDDRRSERDPS